jgi:hypothetical protein
MHIFKHRCGANQLWDWISCDASSSRAKLGNGYTVH